MGGDGSGRKPNPENLMRGNPVVQVRGEEIWIPNLSGVKDEAKKTSTVDITGGGGGAGASWTSGSNYWTPTDNAKFVSGSGFFTDGTISGASIFSGATAVALDGHTHAGGGSTVWTSGANYWEVSTGENKFVSGAGFYTGGTVSGAAYIDANINHDSLLNFAANEHFTEASISHLNVQDVGTKTHAALETDLTSVSGAHYQLETEHDTLSGALFNLQELSDPGADRLLMFDNTDNNIEWATLGTGLDINTNTLNLDFSEFSTDTALSDSEFFITYDTSEKKITKANIRSSLGVDTLSGAYYTHAADSSDPHGANTTQSGTFSGATMIVTADKTTSGAAYVPNIIFGTSSGAHTASNYTQGTLMVIYTA